MRKFIFVFSVLLLLVGCKSQQIEKEPEIEIEVKEPELEIVSIAIIKADLVNTQFESVVKINNPNEFALNLSSLSYELYGNGDFWASGKGEDLLHIPALDSCQTEFRFMMNFINMDRRLLDDIIAMKQVHYRFTGAAEVAPNLPKSSPFIMSFERSGLSNVKEKKDSKPSSAGRSNSAHIDKYVDNW